MVKNNLKGRKKLLPFVFSLHSVQKNWDILVYLNIPFCKIIVGGAVLNREYAEKIGADKYAKDAMAAVRYAEEIFG